MLICSEVKWAWQRALKAKLPSGWGRAQHPCGKLLVEIAEIEFVILAADTASKAGYERLLHIGPREGLVEDDRKHAFDGDIF